MPGRSPCAARPPGAGVLYRSVLAATAATSAALSLVVGGAGQGDEGPAQDAREYGRRLRSLAVDQVLGEFLVSLLNAAQVNLRRRDARLLIDVTAGSARARAPLPPDELTRQIGQMLGQLRMGQVSAESHASQQGQLEENDLDQAPVAPSANAGQ